MERGNTMERRKTFSLRILLLVLAGISSTLVAQTTDSSSWANVRALTPNQTRIAVVDDKGDVESTPQARQIMGLLEDQLH